jgi:hypothetical protein
MLILLIENIVNYHYEVIESIICKYNEILNITDSLTHLDVKIFLNIYKNQEYITYITDKYPEINIGKPKMQYNYYINCTFYAKQLPELIKLNKQNSKTHYYISHDFNNETIKYSNIYYLSPLSGTNRYIIADILPFSYKIQNIELNSKEPIFVIQGGINKYRRDISLIKLLLSINIPNKPFKFKLLGKFNRLPIELIPYKHKLIQKRNLNFIDYHKELLDCYAIVPAISKNTQPQYYSTKLTSSINYAKGYNLPCLIDKELQAIYNLDNVYVYSNENIIEKFKEMINDYYSAL